MSILNLSRCALSVCVAAILAAGCGESQSPIGAPGAMLQSSKLASNANRASHNVVPNHVFDAAYSGSHACTHLISLPPPLQLFQGNGTASVRGFRAESQEIVDYGPPCGSSATSGVFTLTGKRPNDTISGSLSGDYCSADTYTVTGGTGRYSGATGSGTVTFTCTGRHHYKDAWTGTISY